MATIYDVDFPAQAKQILPSQKRKPKNLSYLTALLTPLQTIQNAVLIVFRGSINEQLKYSAQTIVFEAVLNKVFGATSTVPDERIKIINANGVTNANKYVFNRPELQQEVFVFNRTESEDATEGAVIYNRSELMPEADFDVIVPSYLLDQYNTANGTTLTLSQFYTLIQATVEKYRLAGFNNSINGVLPPF